MANDKETVLRDDAFLVSETNDKGHIIFANEEFCQVAEYTQEELVGNPHNMVRHQDMPKAAFKDLWATIQSGEMWQGYVKNATKSGGVDWVYVTIYPYKNDLGEQCYMSIRRKPSRQDIDGAIALYKTMS